jgi:hypothetical protein
MIKRITNTIAILVAVLFLASCSITAPLTATSNAMGKKVGTAKANVIFGLCFGGDYSVQTAAKNGGITKISTVDVKTKNILGIFITKETTVTGD